MREMKDSGIAWVRNVPKIWSLKPIRALFDEVTEKNLLGTCSNALKFTYGSIVRKPNFDADADDYVASTILNYTVVEPGTIMLNGLNLNFDFVSQRIGLVKEKGVITSAYMAFKPNEKQLIDSEFATYLFKAYDGCKAFHNMGGGVRKILNFNEFKKYYIPLPDLNEQQHIVDYLDTKCSEIDATTEDIQKEISLLEDYKKSVITEAVTKGLDPDAEMKDSGVAWIGEIPKDWDLLKIGYVTKEISDIDHYMPSDSDDIDKVPYLMIGDLKENISQIDFESCKYISKKVYRALSIKSKPEKENVIFARYATIGTVCFVDSEKQLLVSYACLTVKANELIKGRFLFYYFKSNAFLEEVSQYVKSNTQGNIGKESLIRAKIVVPKLKEQTQIISYLDTKCSEIEAIIADKKRQLDILTEYKKSLIYEYVTGKKEVPINE